MCGLTKIRGTIIVLITPGEKPKAPYTSRMSLPSDC